MAQIASPSVYVGDLDPSVTETMLYEHFKTVGPIVSVRVCLDSQTQKSLGYGYVNFQNPRDAEEAIEKMNATKLCTKHIRVSKIQRDPAQRKSGLSNIIIKHLPPQTDAPTLREVFSKFGKICSVRVATNEKGESRGYGYVMFENQDSANIAVQEVNGMELGGRQILVERYRHTHRAEMLEQYTNLYVKNLEPTITEEAFRDTFTRFGAITSAKIRTTNDDEAKSLGFGYIAFEKHEAAAKAVEELDGKEVLTLPGQGLYVRRFESKQERLRNRELRRRERQAQYAKYPNLYVKNFDDSVSSDQLKAVFERCGETVSVKVQVDPVTGASRGFGFVSYKDMSSAQKALSELVNSQLLGPRPLFVAFALKKDQRKAQFEDLQKKRMQRLTAMTSAGMYNQPNPLFPQPMQQMFSMPPNRMAGPGMMPALRPTGMMQPGMNMNMIPTAMRARPPPKPTMMPVQALPAMAPMHQQPQAQPQLANMLASMSVEQQKNVLGERLYNYIVRRHPEEAAKVTGMLLEMDNSEILNLLDSPESLDSKIREALEVLARHQAM